MTRSRNYKILAVLDLSEEGDPPLRDPNGTTGRFVRPHPVRSLDYVVEDGLRSEPLAYSGEHLEHDPKLTVQRRAGWHHMPLGVKI